MYIYIYGANTHRSELKARVGLHISPLQNSVRSSDHTRLSSTHAVEIGTKQSDKQGMSYAYINLLKLQYFIFQPRREIASLLLRGAGTAGTTPPWGLVAMPPIR